MHNTKAIETTLIESTRVEIGNDLDVVYIIDAEVFETTTETGMPWVKDIAPGIYYSFIGARFIKDDKIGESTMGRFATLREARQFVENYIAACKIA